MKAKIFSLAIIIAASCFSAWYWLSWYPSYVNSRGQIGTATSTQVATSTIWICDLRATTPSDKMPKDIHWILSFGVDQVAPTRYVVRTVGTSSPRFYAGCKLFN